MNRRDLFAISLLPLLPPFVSSELKLVATVPHSATFALLRALGYSKRRVCPLREQARANPGDILFAHLSDRYMPLILAHIGPIITTSRPTEDIRGSWIRRGRSLDKLEGILANHQLLLKLRRDQVQVEDVRSWR